MPLPLSYGGPLAMAGRHHVHGGVVRIFETHRKEEEVIDGERGFGLS